MDMEQAIRNLWALPEDDVLVSEVSGVQVKINSTHHLRNIAYYQTGYYQIENPLWAVGVSSFQWIVAFDGKRNDPNSYEFATLLRSLAAVDRGTETPENQAAISDFQVNHPMIWDDIANGWKEDPEAFSNGLSLYPEA